MIYTLYDEKEGKRLYIASYKDAFTAEVEAYHVRCSHPRWNVIIVEE